MSKISYLATYSDNNMISTIDYAKLIKLLAMYSNLETKNKNDNVKSDSKKLVRKSFYGKRKILGD